MLSADGGTEVFLDILEFARRIGAPGMTMNGGIPSRAVDRRIR